MLDSAATIRQAYIEQHQQEETPTASAAEPPAEAEAEAAATAEEAETAAPDADVAAAQPEAESSELQDPEAPQQQQEEKEPPQDAPPAAEGVEPMDVADENGGSSAAAAAADSSAQQEAEPAPAAAAEEPAPASPATTPARKSRKRTARANEEEAPPGQPEAAGGGGTAAAAAAAAAGDGAEVQQPDESQPALRLSPAAKRKKVAAATPERAGAAEEGAPQQEQKQEPPRQEAAAGDADKGDANGTAKTVDGQASSGAATAPATAPSSEPGLAAAPAAPAAEQSTASPGDAGAADATAGAGGADDDAARQGEGKEGGESAADPVTIRVDNFVRPFTAPMAQKVSGWVAHACALRFSATPQKERSSQGCWLSAIRCRQRRSGTRDEIRFNNKSIAVAQRAAACRGKAIRTKTTRQRERGPCLERAQQSAHVRCWGSSADGPRLVFVASFDRSRSPVQVFLRVSGPPPPIAARVGYHMTLFRAMASDPCSVTIVCVLTSTPPPSRTHKNSHRDLRPENMTSIRHACTLHPHRICGTSSTSGCAADKFRE